MNNQIPPKGTLGYRRYYRDKDALYELKQLKNRALLAKADALPQTFQHEQFSNAVMHIDQAIIYFEAGWNQEYRA